MPQAVVSTPQRVKEYEVIYVLRPDVDQETAGRVSTRISEVAAREAGQLVKVESWGRRKLAYPVRKFRRGIYVYVRFVGSGDLVTEFERNLRMHRDAVLKFQTVKLRDTVEVADVKIDPEEVKFAVVEPMTDEEREEPRERILGLLEGGGHGRDDRRGRMGEEEEFDNGESDERGGGSDSADDVGGAGADADEEDGS